MRPGLASARLRHWRGQLVPNRVSTVSAADTVVATGATLSRSHASRPAHRPAPCAIKLSWCGRVMPVVARVQPQVVVPVITGAPSCRGSGAELAGVQPQVVVAVIAGLLPRA